MENLNEYILLASVLTPLICALLLAVLPLGQKALGLVSLLGFGLPAIGAVYLWAQFYSADLQLSGYAFQTADLFGAPMPALALNGISLPLFVLAGIVSFAAGVWAIISRIENKRLFMVMALFMAGGLMGAFASLSVLWMYIFHEFALVPTFIATCIWGGAGKRTAAMEMAVYLTLGALVSLIGIVTLRYYTGSFDITQMRDFFMTASLKDGAQGYVFAFFLFGLGALVSLFPFHSWAPRAYSAAPTAFAMMHAGVLKKFGLYVLIQVAVVLLPKGAESWAHVLAYLALGNVIIIGLITMAQRDLKLMISYSSVSHMGICFLGIASLSVLGAGGAVLMMFGHGLSVALMFLLANVAVNRTGQWNMLWMGGLYKKTPVLACFFIAATLASIGLPGFANFWGELAVLLALWKFSPVVCALAATGIIISAIYGLRAVANVFYGKHSAKLGNEDFADITPVERLPAIILLAALLFVGFFPMSLTKGLDASLLDAGVYSQTSK